MAAYDLLIFDFDGTLVPTEELATRLMAPLLLEHLGLDYTHEEVTSRYKGRDMQTQFDDMAKEYGAPLPQTFFTALNDAWIHAVQTELEPTEGAVDALKVLSGIPRCIASNGYHEGIQLALRATGLDAFFTDVFSADDVPLPKPAPDIFLHAAAEIGVSTERCLVIEDTVLGVQGARAAGMSVVGYAGNDPSTAEALRDAGAVVIHSFVELPPLVMTTQ